MGRKANKKIKRFNQTIIGLVYIRTYGKSHTGINMVEVQKNRIFEYCKDKNIKVKHVYIDENIDEFDTGMTAYKKLIEKVKNEKDVVLVISTLKIIARNDKEKKEVLNLMEKHDFRILMMDSNEEFKG